MIKLDMPQKCARVLYDPLRRRYRILYGGRGSAKSWSVARYLLIRGASEKLRILCTREIQNSIKDSVYKLLVEQIEALGLSDYFIVSADKIESRTGSEIIFKGIARNTTGIRSTEGIDICWVEEAEALTAESWRVLTPTIRKEGSIIIVTFNPDDERSATYERFVAKFDEKSGAFLPVENPRYCREFVNYWDNPWFPDVLREDMEWDRQNDPDLYEHVWCGKPKRYGHAVIFKDKIEIRDFETPDGIQFFFGEDFGSPSGDPNALVRMFIIEGNLHIDHEAHGHVELDDLHAFLGTVPNSREWEIIADNARPETINFLQSPHVDNSGAQHAGFNIKSCEKGKGSVNEGIAFLKKFKKIVIHPRCKGTIQDFQNYRWKIDKITGKVLPIPVDLANHACDAARYGLEEWMKGGASIYDIL